MDSELRNPLLYRALHDLFGSVGVGSRGVSGAYNPPSKTSIFKPTKGLKDKTYAVVTSWGENYSVSCPVCEDKGKHLCFSHLWGGHTSVPGKKSKLYFGTHAFICYRNGCHKSLEMRPFIRKILDHMETLNLSGTPLELQVEPIKNLSNIGSLITVPKGILPLSSQWVPRCVDSFLSYRKLDPYILESSFNVGVVLQGSSCTDGNGDPYIFQEDCLFIPIIQGRKVVAWQARRVVIPAPGEKLKMKYIFPPGFRKQECLYNIDNARKHDHIIICEGVSDVWRIGPNAVALFGKTMSSQQEELLKTTCGYYSKGVVLLDPDARSAATALTERLALNNVFSKGVTQINLENTDPGDMSDSEVEELQNHLKGSSDVP